jgi:hypothetical protein
LINWHPIHCLLKIKVVGGHKIEATILSLLNRRSRMAGKKQDEEKNIDRKESES